jgi:glutamine amidotransferase
MKENKEVVGILDYGLGNINSVQKALNFLNFESLFVKTATDLDNLETLIIPGVGTYEEAMRLLQNLNLVKPIIEFANAGKKVIGICLGMQILSTKGTEPNETFGLNLIPGDVIKIPNSIKHPIPHVGWNNIVNCQEQYKSFLLELDFYFIHSFHYIPENKENILCTTEYGENIVAAIKKNNIYGFQFHPEKSQTDGLNLLKKILDA